MCRVSVVVAKGLVQRWMPKPKEAITSTGEGEGGGGGGGGGGGKKAGRGEYLPNQQKQGTLLL